MFPIVKACPVCKENNTYNVFRIDHPSQAAPGGGVTILVHKDLICSEVSLLNNEDMKESIWCEIKCTEVNIILGVVYRTPSSSVDDNLRMCNTLRLGENLSGNKQILHFNTTMII